MNVNNFVPGILLDLYDLAGGGKEHYSWEMKMLCTLIVVITGGAFTSLGADEFFYSHIEPILRKRCFECHSHETKMKAGLSLDSKSGWEKGGDSGPAIKPGNLTESILIRMVNWSDEDHQMPPKNKLPNEEIALLEKWVKRGAPDPRIIKVSQKNSLDWWSLKPLKRSDVPDGEHPIDYFVQAKLNEKNLKPSQKADRRSLARRLYVDLHGLLPTSKEVDIFVKEENSKAWESLIDELLSSPRYGERWARHWLDTIHFADSHGCEHDVKRPNAWRFRDYVISRLNEDVPWDRFIKEQLAPDVFYPDEPELMAGLGFIAAGPLELSRAGTAPVTFDYLDRDDIVSQTMSAFVSTTANCARCHAHKFDPVSQEDYYSLQAVFAGVGKGDIEFEPSGEVMNRRKELELIIATNPKEEPQLFLKKRYIDIVNEWEKTQSKQKKNHWTTLKPEIFVSSGGATLSIQNDSSIFASGPMSDQEEYVISSSIALDKLSAVRIEALKDKRLPKGGPGRADNGNLHLSEVELHWFPSEAKEAIKLPIKRASASFDQDGWTAKHAIDGDSKSGWAIYPNVNKSHQIILELENQVDTSDGGRLVLTLKQNFPPKHYIGRTRISVTDAENGVVNLLPERVVRKLSIPRSQRSIKEKALIASIALKEYATTEIKKLPLKEVVYGVSSSWSHAKKLEKPQLPKVVHILKRGDIDKPLREVGPGALAVIPNLAGRFGIKDPNNESAKRAALAQWIADSENPLTWRSIVNRVWLYHFGVGLTDTPNDFGRMGSKPTHPELLDWLAIWFRDEANGSLKALHKLILTSHTWQQTSLDNANSGDSDNRFLWRMNRRRLDAEAYRDSALSMAGKLDLTMGGPGIEQFKKNKGPQSTPSLDYSAFDWTSDEAKRRSIYRVVWRGIPDPFMESLDFPDLSILTGKRGFSVSALQSLSLYNNDFVMQVSQWMADKVNGQTDAVSQVVEECWQRKPTNEELEIFENYTKSHGLDALCRVLYNSNEFLFVD